MSLAGRKLHRERLAFVLKGFSHLWVFIDLH